MWCILNSSSSQTALMLSVAILTWPASPATTTGTPKPERMTIKQEPFYLGQISSSWQHAMLYVEYSAIFHVHASPICVELHSTPNKPWMEDVCTSAQANTGASFANSLGIGAPVDPLQMWTKPALWNTNKQYWNWNKIKYPVFWSRIWSPGQKKHFTLKPNYNSILHSIVYTTRKHFTCT